MVKGTPAREAALEILRRVRSGQAFGSAHAAAVDRLADPDRRLAHEIAAGVLRGRNELDKRLRSLVSWRRTSPDLKDLLRIGAYQIAHLERVPPYAAVQATVEVAKKTDGTRGAGLVNAVLRRVAANHTKEDSCDRGENSSDLADTHSHPVWLVERWVHNFGFDRTKALLEHNNRRPPLMIQPVRWTSKKLEAQLSTNEVRWKTAPFGGGFVVEGVTVRDLPGYDEGAFVVQDAAQARLLEHVAIANGLLVWDACASPGGKAAILSGRGPMVVSDLRRDRIDRLRDTLDRVQSPASVFVGDARFPPLAKEKIDVTLVDAPCTATGTLRRHPDGRWRLTERGLESTVRRQAELLEGASAAVRPGALLVYLTCSLEPEENEEQVDRFLDNNADFERDGVDLFLFPPDFGTDGGFAARLRRSL